MYNSYNPEASNHGSSLVSFKHYLIAEKISKGSIRSYLSDVRHFFAWLKEFLEKNQVALTMKQPASPSGGLDNEIVTLLNYVNSKLLEAYQACQLDNNVPIRTINRRFSSLRKFGNFCQSQNWINLNPFDSLRNISQSDKSRLEERYRLKEFRLYLWQNKASQSTIKNYLNDIRQFIEWSEKAMIPIQPD
jgi:site-specific recombinase XerD